MGEEEEEKEEQFSNSLNVPKINMDISLSERILENLLPSSKATNQYRTLSRCSSSEVILSTNSIHDIFNTVQVIQATRLVIELKIITASRRVFIFMKRDLGSTKLNFDMETSLIDTGGLVLDTFLYKMKSHTAWKSLDVTYALIPPGVIMGPTGQVFGIDIEVLGLIKSFLGPSFEFRETWSYGFDATLAGLFSENVTTELCIGPNLFGLDLFSQGVEYSVPILPMTIYFSYKIPGPIPKFYTLTFPFTSLVWVFVIASVLFMLVYLMLSNLLGSARVSIFHMVAISAVSLLVESMPKHYLQIRNNHWLTYVALFLWMTMTCFLSLAYRSILLASLAAKEYEEPLKEFQELVDNGIPVIQLRGTTTVDMQMKYAPNPAINQLYEELVQSDNYYDSYPAPPWVIEKALSGEIAQMTTKMHFVGQRHLLKMSEEYIPPFTLSGYLYRIKYPFKEEIDRCLGRALDSGIYQAIYDKYTWMMAKPERDHERSVKTESETALSTAHLAALWIMTSIGLALALLAFAAEWLVGVSSNRMTNRYFVRHAWDED